MSKQYTGVTRTLELGATSYRGTIFKPSKPPLDSELNFIGDLQNELIDLQISQALSTGFYPVHGATSIAYDLSGSGYGPSGYAGVASGDGVILGSTPNQFIVNNPQNSPFQLNVIGDTLTLGGSNVENPAQLSITLPTAPASGSRQDLVYLEFWYQQVDPLSTVGKPSSSTVYAFGNLDSELVNPPDNMYDSQIATDTTSRVQLQYRLRVVAGVDFVNHPDGVDDGLNVFPMATNNAVVNSYTFTRHPTDSGVFVAGNGSPSAVTNLRTVDGFVYGVPLFRIHRRNTAPFTLLNLNGASKSILQGSSDRPDGYFYDKVEAQDIEDLRHFLPLNQSFDEMLEGAFHDLLSGNLGTLLMESQLGSDQDSSKIGLYINGMSVADETGVDEVAIPNSQRRVISDALTTQRTILKVNISDRTVGSGIDWNPGDQFLISLAGTNPAGTVFGERYPEVYCVTRISGVESKTSVPITVTPVGSTILIATVGTLPAGVGNQTLSVDFDIVFQPGSGLTYVPTVVKQVYEYRDNVNYSFVSENNPTGSNPTSLVTTASANDIIIGRNSQEAFTTLGFASVTANGTQTYSVGPTYGGVPVTHINYAIVNGTLITRSTSPLYIQQILLNNDGSISCTFNQAVSVNIPIVFGVGLANNAVRIQENTKSITEVSQVVTLTKTFLAGDNVTEVSIDASGLVYGTQSEKASANTYQDICYINNQATPCAITVDGSFVTITGLPATLGVSQTDTLKVVANASYALASDQRLRVYYQYVPYQGVTARQSFGNGADSYLKTKVVKKANGMLVHTSGTNGINPSVPPVYAPMSVKLPKSQTDKDSDLGNQILGAPLLPSFKGLDISSDFTVNQKLGFTDFDASYGWSSANADTTVVALDPNRQLFRKGTLRFNKSGTTTSYASVVKTPSSLDWSSIIDTSGNLLNSKELVFWFYVPNPAKVANVMLQLQTSGGNHVYGVYSEIQAGWNKASFGTRSEGSATSTTLTAVAFLVNVTNSSTVDYGYAVLPPYIENVAAAEDLTDGDLFFALDQKQLFRFTQSVGMSVIGDNGGMAFYKDRNYAFEVPVVAGNPGPSSPHVVPPVPGEDDYLTMNGVNNTRGTYLGSSFYSSGVDTVAPVSKQAVVYVLEQVIEDPTGNFAQGEFVLKVGTKISTGTVVEVSNSDFSTGNSFDVFRIPGRPLGKLS